MDQEPFNTRGDIVTAQYEVPLSCKLLALFEAIFVQHQETLGMLVEEDRSHLQVDEKHRQLIYE